MAQFIIHNNVIFPLMLSFVSLCVFILEKISPPHPPPCFFFNHHLRIMLGACTLSRGPIFTHAHSSYTVIRYRGSNFYNERGKTVLNDKCPSFLSRFTTWSKGRNHCVWLLHTLRHTLNLPDWCLFVLPFPECTMTVWCRTLTGIFKAPF